jgi:hypothetical protein
MLPGILFTFWRSCQLLTLIPVIGMLSYFVNVFTKNNQLTPAYILALFIVSVLAAFWALATLLAYGMTKWNAHFCAFVDLLFVGAFIAGVYYLRGITNYDCVSFPTGQKASSGIDLGFAQLNGAITMPYFNKTCSMLKASFAFGIMNIIFFFITFVSLLPSLWFWRLTETAHSPVGRARACRLQPLAPLPPRLALVPFAQPASLAPQQLAPLANVRLRELYQ